MLVEQIREHLASDVAGAIAMQLGEPAQRVHAAVSASIPLLLSGVAELAARPDGARAALRSMREQPPTLLDHFDRYLAPDRMHALMRQGADHFIGIFGRQRSDALAQTLSRFSGTNITAAHSLLSLFTPVVLSGIARYSHATEPAALATYMHSQRGSIDHSMPAGLGEYIEQAPPLEFLAVRQGTYDEGVAATGNDDEMQDFAAAPRQEIVSGLHGRDDLHRVEERASDHSRGSPDRPPGLAWAIPIMILLAVFAGIVYLVYPTTADNVRPMTPDRTDTVMAPGHPAAPPEAIAAGARLEPIPEPANLSFLPDRKLGWQLTSDLKLLPKLCDQFARGRTEASAEPQLQSISMRLNALREEFDHYAPGIKDQVVRELRKVMPAVHNASARVEGEAGREHIAQHLNDITEDIRAMTEQR